MERKAGILMPISALPSRFGIGDFGKSAYRFVDCLSDAGFKLWQILPLNPLGFGHSPYQPFSSYALDEIYVDLDSLCKNLDSINETAPRVEYEACRCHKTAILRKIFAQIKEDEAEAIEKFSSSNDWVRPWAHFMSMKRHNGMRPWDEWDNTAVAEEDIQYEIWLQMILYKQWDKLHRYANHKGVKIIGDLPFYVGYDSEDVYDHQDQFLLDEETKKPTFVAGVPPDYFSEFGQRWGNPIYDFDKMKESSYSFLVNRIKGCAKIYDILRLDHFRAFDTYWKIPATCETAQIGEWVEAPGYEIFDELFKQCPGLEIIAEDLGGDMREEVYELRDHYGFPGMKVIQFTFEEEEILKKKPKDKENLVVYLGTHDNPTIKSYFLSLDEDLRGFYTKILEKHGYNGEDINEMFVRYLLDQKGKYAILTMQDILGLGDEGRINNPGLISDDNWSWRLLSLKPFESKVDFLKGLNKKYER